MRGILMAATVVALPSFLVTFSADAAEPRCDGRRATIVGSDASEVIHGTPHRDVILARGGNDFVEGRGGDDVICGGYGADFVFGGGGNDRLFGGADRLLTTDEGVERIGDVVRGGPGDDLMVPGLDSRPADEVARDTLAWDRSAHRVRLDLAEGRATGDGHDRIFPRGASVVGSRYADVILGSAGSDVIAAGRGSDLVRAGGGDDTVVADAVANATSSETGADTVYGGPGADELIGYGGVDRLYGGSGPDLIADWGRGPDRLAGGTGSDAVYDQLSTDPGSRFAGGTGHDRLELFTQYVDVTNGSFDMAAGSLTLDALELPAAGFEALSTATYQTTWTVDGTNGDNEVSASGSLGTTMRGLGGHDEFFGSAYDDFFDGGPGSDRAVTMGVGTDTCVSVEVIDQDDCEIVLP